MHAERYFTDDSRDQFQRMLDGDPYIANDPQHAVQSQRAMTLAARYEREYLADSDAAAATLAELCGTAANVEVRPPLRIDYGFNLHIGDGTFINYNLTALDVAPIRIGRSCQIGPNVQLLTPTHPLEPIPRRDGIEGGAPIELGDNVWLGGGVIVCPGVTIGTNSVIGARSVVTRDVPPNAVAVGNPARVIRTLDATANPYTASE
ncbi:sugar O-acetyltransferase [Gulosibacter bifidus]|uniref:Sugar O-acetyltransferase n=1 Tax=Gulosibacter bifidus TaxID=272239 RepID=A0ABW5RFL0_9MICO|nr:sugar O-acetyltransferase [Gulosibacter bifidus]